jgi:ketosteroid isomerase-like protein
MKIRLLHTLAALAISFALPTFAQQKDTVDPKRAQQIRALEMKWNEVFNRSESGALAALYTEDAVRVTPHGTFRGRQAIAKDYAEHDFQRYQSKNYVRKGDRVIAVGNEVRATGKWSCAFHDTDFRDKHIDGHYLWVLVREGDTWQIRRDTYDEGNGY